MAVSGKSKKELIEEIEALRSRLEGLERREAERNSIEKALRESGARLRAVIESLPFDFFLIDQNGRYAMLNEVCKQRWGDVVGKRPEDVCPDQHTLALWQSNNRRALAGEIVEGEVVLQPQGREGYYRNIISPIRDGDEIQGILGVNIDITQYKETEIVLRETTQLLETIFDTTHILIAYLDPQFNFIKTNKAYALADEKEPSFFPGKNHFDLYPNEENEAIFRRVVETGESYFADTKPFEYAEHPERGVSYWDWSLIPIQNQHNSVTGLVLSLANVTGRELAEEALRESEGKLGAMLQSIGDHMSMMDKDLNIIWANEKAKNIFGEDIVGMKCYKAYHQRDKPCEPYPCLTLKAFQDGKVHKHDTQVVSKDGKNIYFHCTANVALRDTNGKPTAVLEISRDITERKKAEEALRSERDKLQTLMGGLALTGIGIDVVSIDYRVLFQNQTLIERFGDITGKLCYEKYMGLKKPCDFCPMTKAIRNKEVESVELTAINGRSYELLSAPLANPDGTVDKAFEVLKDVTEHKKAEEKLQESELKFKTIFENAGGAIFIADNKTGEILECNSQAEQMLGRPRAEIIGMHQSDLHPQGEEEKYKEKFATHVQKGHVVDFEGEVQQRDGTRIPVWIAAQCLKIDGKDVIIGLFVDTMKRKKAEQKLIENRAKLKSLASQLSLIEERERRRLATYLHDQIGQSLVMSKMKLDSLRQSVSSGKSAGVMGEVSDCLGQVIQDTRSLTFDLSSPILYELGFEAAVADWLDEQIREKYGIKTDFEDDRQPKPLDDDIRVLLFRNVRELLVNVVKHANAKNVKVSIRKVDDRICVSVEDDGVGFDVNEIEAMAVKKAEFGLFSVRERLEQLGGHLEIESEPGQGSRITMVAPLKSK